MTVLSIGQVWADDPAAQGTTLFSEDFSSYSADDVPSGDVTTATGRVVYGGATVAYTCTNSGTKIYNQNTGGGTAPEILVAKNGGTFAIAGIPSGGAQVITVSLTQNNQALSVEPSGTGYSGSVSGKPGAVGTRTFDITVADGADATFTLTFTGSGSSNVRVDDIVVTVKTAGEGAATPTCATPTFSPVAGTFYGSQEITLATGTDGASIYYTTDGTTPSSTNGTLYEDPFEITATTTIKAIAVKDGANDSEIAEAIYTAGATITSYDIDFEANNLAAYVNWNFENIVCASTAITAHAGTYYGNTNAKSTASITTKAKYANPGTLTFYISKESGNTTASSWYAQVSEDGEAWTDVETFDAKSMSKGAWNECTADLSAYSNVYVRISYGSSTAIRAIDDISLAPAAAVAQPSIFGETPFVTTTTVTLGCTTDGASIYYTTDGTDPSSSSTLYEDPFELNAGATVKAIAIKESISSSIASKVFEKVTSYSTLAAIFAKATEVDETATDIYVTFDSWKISAKTNNNAFLTDGTNGAVIYGSGHGFNAGDVLTGTAACKVQLYKGFAELTALTSGTTGLTVTPGSVGDPVVKTWDQLSAVNTGALVQLENLTYDGSSLSDGVNTIPTYTTFYTATFEAGKSYNLSGVYQYYESAGQILPRSEADVQEILETFTVTYNNAPENGTLTIKNGDDVVTSGSAVNEGTVLDIVTSPAEGYKLAGVTVNGSAYTEATIELTEDITIVASFEENLADPVNSYVLSVLGDETPQSVSGLRVGDKVHLPSTATACSKTFVGWDLASDCSSVPAYAPGAEYTLALDNKLYAVYATANPGAITNYQIDFENNADTYTDWTLTNITSKQTDSGVNAHEGDYFGVTDGKATASLVTKEKIANPSSLTVYVSKKSTNTSASTWYAQISDDGSNWTDVESVNGASMSKGTWVELSADLTSYSDVYVRVYYSGSTAVRCIDDLVLSTQGPTTYSDYSTECAPAPVTLVSVAISGTATELEYTEGDEFNPAGLSVTGTYSDDSTAPITEGITWAYNPAKLSTSDESVSVTATVSGITSAAFVVEDLVVSAAPVVTDNVVILAVYDTKYYAMSTNNVSSAFTAIAVEYDGSQVTVNSEADKAAIQWTRTTSGENTTFQDADEQYIKGTSSGAAMSLDANVCNWSWDDTNGYYYIGGRSFFYQAAGGAFKNYSISTNMGQSGYSDKAQVIVIDPANIVVTSKVSAELAYDPESDEITQGNAWSAPSLVNPYTVTITSYASDNEAVATVEGGVIALAGGIGTAHITAHFDGDASYLEGDAVYTITVNAPAPTPSGTTYTKVTSTSDITDGEYLIVYEDENVAFNGNLTTLDAANNTVSVVISEGVIAGTTAIDAAVFTIDVANGTLRSHMGDYIGVSTYGNGLKQNASANYPAHTFAIDGDNAVISIYGETWNSGGPGSMILNYNKAVSDKRFRYYKGGSQQPIQLYKKETPEPPTPVYETVRTGLTSGKYYTICYNQTMTAIRGASLWEFAGKDASFAYIQPASAPFVAGTPYIIYAESEKLEAVVEEVASPVAGNHNGLYGTFAQLEQSDFDNIATITGKDVYFIYNTDGEDSELRKVNGQTDNWIRAYRAYVIVADIPSAPAHMPAHVRKMPMQNQTTTGCELIHAAEAPAKMMINGQIFILRGEKKYDATGRLVK